MNCEALHGPLKLFAYFAKELKKQNGYEKRILVFLVFNCPEINADFTTEKSGLTGLKNMSPKCRSIRMQVNEVGFLAKFKVTCKNSCMYNTFTLSLIL